jgi:hypothetical protein
MTLLKEPHASLANQLELATPNNKLLLPIGSRNNTLSDQVSVINPKFNINKLTDLAIQKMLEQAMDEMIHVDAHAFDLNSEMLSYKDYLYKLLLTRYGLSQLANGYI